MRAGRILSVLVLFLLALVTLNGCGVGPAAPFNPAPTVTLAASPTSIASNGSATLTWSSTGATSLSIDNGVGTVAASGSVTVKPTATTTYTITVVGAGGTTKATAVVTVNPAAPTVTI